MINYLLPIKHLIILLQYTEDASAPFFHQLPLTAFLRNLSDHHPDYEKLISIDAVESCHTLYKEKQYYRFSLFAYPGSESLVAQLIDDLQQLPLSVTAQYRKEHYPFRNNLKLIMLHDGFTSKTINNVAELTAYNETMLQAEINQWQELLTEDNSLSLHWVSPVRFLIPKDKNNTNKQGKQKKRKGEGRYCHDQHDLSATQLLTRVHNSLADLASKKDPDKKRQSCPEIPDVHYLQNHCFWVDNNYSSNGKEKPIGGMLGVQTLRFSSASQKLVEQWLKILVLGQYTGVGQMRTFGLGRYILKQGSHNSIYQRVFPAQSLLSEILDKDNLDQALSHNHQDEYDDDDDAESSQLARIIKKIEKDTYQPPTLNGYLIDKNSGGQRLLMVPPFWDRVMQRSFAQVLSAKLEDIMDPHSYGFRRGRSRITAKYDIQLAYREGYRWVYESDIKDFFSQLDISKLMIRLQGLFYNDPCLSWIKKWMQAPLQFEGKKYQRSMSLPQGSPLSPVLANLFLDDFDNDMKTHGFRLIRFADDFVILCKTQEQAQQAAEKVELSLTEHGMSLNKDKTSIKTMAQGFYYLGYLFVNDMVLEAKAPPIKNALLPAEIAERFHLGDPQEIKKMLDDPKPDQKDIAVLSQADNGNDNGIFVCVQGKAKWLSLSQGRIRIMDKDIKISEQPLSYIQAIILMGSHQLSTQVIHACLKHNVPIYFATSYGRFLGSSWSGQPQLYGSDFWLLQQQVFTQPENALKAAKMIVKARLSSQWEVLRQRQMSKISEDIKEIKVLLTKVDFAATLAELNGYEGSAAKHYFAALSELIPETYHFTHRNRRPPKDPVNNLLPLGYTILYNYVDSFIRVNGLFPWLGLYHQPRSNYSPLAADLMEAHRYLVERCVLTAISLNKIVPDDFFQGADDLYKINNKARRKFTGDLIKRFDANVKGRGDQKAENLIAHLTRQNQNIALWIRHQAELEIWSIR